MGFGPDKPVFKKMGRNSDKLVTHIQVDDTLASVRAEVSRDDKGYWLLFFPGVRTASANMPPTEFKYKSLPKLKTAAGKMTIKQSGTRLLVFESGRSHMGLDRLKNLIVADMDEGRVKDWAMDLEAAKEALVVTPYGFDKNGWYGITIKNKDYKYIPKGLDQKAFDAKFRGIMKHNKGRALAWLKKNSYLAAVRGVDTEAGKAAKAGKTPAVGGDIGKLMKASDIKPEDTYVKSALAIFGDARRWAEPTIPVAAINKWCEKSFAKQKKKYLAPYIADLKKSSYAKKRAAEGKNYDAEYAAEEGTEDTFGVVYIFGSKEKKKKGLDEGAFGVAYGYEEKAFKVDGQELIVLCGFETT